jgi:hypothetical protein
MRLKSETRISATSKGPQRRSPQRDDRPPAARRRGDGASLFPRAASRRGFASAVENVPGAQTHLSDVPGVPALSQTVAPATVATGSRRFFFYSPELHLIAESELTTGASPAILSEYIWFSDRPVAQGDTTGMTSWTFADHLGTPILQTSAVQGSPGAQSTNLTGLSSASALSTRISRCAFRDKKWSSSQKGRTV